VLVEGNDEHHDRYAGITRSAQQKLEEWCQINDGVKGGQQSPRKSDCAAPVWLHNFCQEVKARHARAVVNTNKDERPCSSISRAGDLRRLSGRKGLWSSMAVESAGPAGVQTGSPFRRSSRKSRPAPISEATSSFCKDQVDEGRKRSRCSPPFVKSCGATFGSGHNERPRGRKGLGTAGPESWRRRC